ncbi:MAG: DUF1294 domain-containing protein [Clostridia bacterium]|nr:DUF1294 domain-containing protein [Clostridia bacterium]
MYHIILLIVFAAYLLIMSLIAIGLYKKDKKMAGGGTEVRIKEKYLLGVAVMGGAAGAFIARLLFRHKTNKFYFTVTILLSLLLQAGTLVLMVINAVQ